MQQTDTKGNQDEAQRKGNVINREFYLRLELYMQKPESELKNETNTFFCNINVSHYISKKYQLEWIKKKKITRLHLNVAVSANHWE